MASNLCPQCGKKPRSQLFVVCSDCQKRNIAYRQAEIAQVRETRLAARKFEARPTSSASYKTVSKIQKRNRKRKADKNGLYLDEDNYLDPVDPNECPPDSSGRYHGDNGPD